MSVNNISFKHICFQNNLGIHVMFSIEVQNYTLHSDVFEID